MLFRSVIGSGGKVIQKITADTGCKIDINDDGMIYIASEDIEACRAARQTIENIVFEPEVGQLYYGQVVRIIPIGAFIELVPGKDGMCHIKDLEFKRTEKVEDVLNIGDWTWVKVSEIDERGRVNLSRKDFDDFFRKSYSSYDLNYVVFDQAGSADFAPADGTFYSGYGTSYSNSFSRTSLADVRFYYSKDDVRDGDYELDDLTYSAASSFTGCSSLPGCL